jgi:hypothetical protein
MLRFVRMRVGLQRGRPEPRSSRRGVLGGVVLLGLLLGTARCYSPTLPLPPPVAPDVSVTETGAFRATGSVLGEAQVFVVNERSGAINGQWVGADGHYDFLLSNARYEDPMQIWYQLGTDLSPTTRFNLPEAPDIPQGTGGEGGQGG